MCSADGLGKDWEEALWIKLNLGEGGNPEGRRRYGSPSRGLVSMCRAEDSPGSGLWTHVCQVYTSTLLDHLKKSTLLDKKEKDKNKFNIKRSARIVRKQLETSHFFAI
jgi:hypothetical protein